MKKTLSALLLLSVLVTSGCKTDKGPSSTSTQSNPSSDISSSDISSPDVSSPSDSSTEIPSSSLSALEIAVSDALAELDAYFNALNEDDFLPEDWVMLVSEYQLGRTLIASAKTLNEVDSRLAIILETLSSFEAKNITFQVISAFPENGYLFLQVNGRKDDLSALEPVSDLSCSLGSLRFVELVENGSTTYIVLEGVDTALNKGDFTIDLTINSRYSNSTSLHIEIYNGYLKNLDTFKSFALAELNEYLTLKGYTSDKYNSTDWSAIQGYINAGIAAINAATSFEEIAAALAEAKLNIDATPQSGIALPDYKLICLAQLEELFNELDESSYHPDNWAKVVNFYNTGVQAIEAATSQRDVIIALNTALEAISGVTKNMMILLLAQTATEYNADWISIVFTNFPVGMNLNYTITVNGYPCTFGRMVGAEMHIQLPMGYHGTDYVLSITGESGNTVYYCNVVMSGGKMTQLPTLKESAKVEIEQYALSRGQTNYAPADWNTIMAIVAQAKIDIDKATTTDAVKAILQAAKNQINDVPMALDNYKALRIQDLHDYLAEYNQSDFTTEDWAKIQQYLAQATTTINAATTKSQVDTAYNAFVDIVKTFAPTYLPLTIEQFYPHGVYFVQFGWKEDIVQNDIASHSMVIKDVNTNQTYNGVFSRFVTNKNFIYSFDTIYNGNGQHYILTITLNATNGDVYKIIIDVSASGIATKIG